MQLDQSYMRGVPTALVRERGNAHLLLRPVRQALYHQLGLSSILEEFPVWCADTGVGKGACGGGVQFCGSAGA
jgi:hypothetical protein